MTSQKRGKSKAGYEMEEEERTVGDVKLEAISDAGSMRGSRVEPSVKIEEPKREAKREESKRSKRVISIS